VAVARRSGRDLKDGYLDTAASLVRASAVGKYMNACNYWKCMVAAVAAGSCYIAPCSSYVIHYSLKAENDTGNFGT
jgi:hypothetical protein